MPACDGGILPPKLDKPKAKETSSWHWPHGRSGQANGCANQVWFWG
jgi:hypothetical protein